MPYTPLSSHAWPGFAEVLPADPPVPAAVLRHDRAEGLPADPRVLLPVSSPPGVARVTLAPSIATASGRTPSAKGQLYAALRAYGAPRPRRTDHWQATACGRRLSPVWTVSPALVGDPAALQRAVFGAVVFYATPQSNHRPSTTV